MKILVSLLVAAVPLLIAPGLLFHFDITPKIAVFLLGVNFLLIFCIWGMWNPLRRFLRTRLGRPFAILLGAQWLWFTLATLLSTHWQLSVNGSSWRRCGLLVTTALFIFTLFVAAWLANDPRRFHSLFRALVGAGAIASLYGIGQYFGIDPFQDPASYQVGEPPFTIVRPPGPIGHADYFAAWLLPIVFVAWLSAARETKRWFKAASYTVSFLAAAAIVLSGTRAAALGLLAGFLTFVILDKVRVTFRVSATAACGLICCALFVISPAGAKVRARAYWTSRDAFGGARILLWRDSVRMIFERPLLGFGPETFATEFPRWQSIELARAYPDFYHESPHNLLLDLSAGEGVPAMFLLIGCIGLAAYAGYSVIERQRSVAAPLLAALAAIVVCQQFMVLVLATAQLFYLVLAMLVAIAAPAELGELAARPRWRLFTVVCGVGMAVAMAGLTIQLCFADSALALAQRRITASDLSGAREAYADTLRWIPPGAGSDLYYSRAMSSLAQSSPIFGTRLEAFHQAFASGIRAAANAEDRQNAWYNLATLFAQRNDPASVERCLRNAIAWAPNWFKPHWTLAQVLELSKHRTEAMAEAAAAVERDGGKHPEVAATLSGLQGRKN